jgi:hypothetical protein
MRINLAYFGLLSLLCLTSASYAWDPVVVIGDWEGDYDGWFVGGGASAAFYTGWSSLHDVSLEVTTPGGWGAYLGIRLQDVGHMDDFLSHGKFSIDLMAPADTLGVSGWEEIYRLSINAEGCGWKDLPPSPALHVDFWSGSPQRVFTVTWDYSSILPSIPSNPGWIELILTLNSDYIHNKFYFDNARLWDVIPGDIYSDGMVNLVDLSLLFTHWLSDDCDEPDWCEGADIDMGGYVDFADVAILANYWLEGVNP